MLQLYQLDNTWEGLSISMRKHDDTHMKVALGIKNHIGHGKFIVNRGFVSVV